MREMIDPLETPRWGRPAGQAGSPVTLSETAGMVIVRLAVPGAEGRPNAPRTIQVHIG